MIYSEAKLLGWRPIYTSWIGTLPAAFDSDQVTMLTSLVSWLFPPMLRVSKEVNGVLPIQEINLTVTCMRLFHSLLDEWRDTPQVCTRLFEYATNTGVPSIPMVAGCNVADRFAGCC
jgi:dynein heavy chain, axonemal